LPDFETDTSTGRLAQVSRFGQRDRLTVSPRL
jgi:hypothetical protein